MPKYEVAITRTTTRRYKLEVEAANEAEVRQKALSQAGDINFFDGTESEPEYGVEEVNEIDAPKLSTVGMVEPIHVKARYSDGTEQTCDVPDLETAAHEIEETVLGCDFATTLDSVELVDEKDEAIRALEATWSLSIGEKQ